MLEDVLFGLFSASRRCFTIEAVAPSALAAAAAAAAGAAAWIAKCDLYMLLVLLARLHRISESQRM